MVQKVKTAIKTGNKPEKVKKPRKAPKAFLEAAKKYQFKPGESGNPNGTPKGERLSTQIRRLLSEVGAKGTKGKEYTNGELIMKALLKKARYGDARSIEILFDRLEGKPKSGLLNVDEDDDDTGISSIKVTIERD
jgi:hypothetical protein